MKRASLQWSEAGDGRLKWADDFLAPSDCRRILEELASAHWRESRVRRRLSEAQYQAAPSRRRTSTSADEKWFPPTLRTMLRAIDRRLNRHVQRFTRRREYWQATRYAIGDRFDDHLDAGAFAHEPQGERTYTVMIYLQSPRTGGTTRFRCLDVDLEPVAGRIVIWKNLTRQRKADGQMLHASLPVLAGRKTILATHVRQRQVVSRR